MASLLAMVAAGAALLAVLVANTVPKLIGVELVSVTAFCTVAVTGNNWGAAAAMLATPESTRMAEERKILFQVLDFMFCSSLIVESVEAASEILLLVMVILLSRVNHGKFFPVFDGSRDGSIVSAKPFTAKEKITLGLF
ncbi:MAG: hypothetical protein B7Y41_02165 [Hydrogenophilales bacterium 28-61-23]|nr:MAG: hypothetical protein B7Y41_02165 [Hydrogenophilales bacterium 28-61-23]